jgi:hypothetical protein
MRLKAIIRPLYTLPYEYQVKLLDISVSLFNTFPISKKLTTKDIA